MAKKASRTPAPPAKLHPETLPAVAASGQWLSKAPFHLLLIALVAVIGYANSFGVPFVFDDISSIVDNAAIRDLGTFLSGGGMAYNPRRFLGYLSLALNYRIGGLDPAGYHVVNLAIHIACAWLVYVLCRLTLTTPFFRRAQLPQSGQAIIPLLAALLFVAHPIQTQAVTYVVQRLASLATLFYLSALVFFAKGRLLQEESGAPFSAKGAVFFLFALLFSLSAFVTKEITATLPLALLLYDFSFFGKGLKKRYLVIAASVLCLVALGAAALSADRPLGELISDISRATRETEQLSRSEYLFTQFSVIVTYLRLLVFPVNQNVDYDFPVYHSFFAAPVFLSFLLLALLLAFALYLYLSPKCAATEGEGEGGAACRRLIGFGILWFFLTLSVESSLVPISDVIFEHRLYLPSFGAFVALASLLFLLFRNTASSTRTVVAACLVAVLTLATFQRNSAWADSIALWSDNVAKSPGKSRPHNNLAKAYLLEGRLEEARREATVAVQLAPESYESRNNLGAVLEKMGALDEAISEYRQALALHPNFATALTNLGAALENKGAIAEAIGYYRKAVELDGSSMSAHNNLGGALMKQGDLGQAVKHLKEAIRLDPAALEPSSNFAVALERSGALDEAISAYREILNRHPGYADGHYNLGVAFHRKKEMENAIQSYQEALRLNPQYAKAHIGTGLAYAALKRIDKALEQFQLARRLAPQDPEAIALEAKALQFLQAGGR